MNVIALALIAIGITLAAMAVVLAYISFTINELYLSMRRKEGER